MLVTLGTLIVYKSELSDNIIRLFSTSCYDQRNSINFEVPRFNLGGGQKFIKI